MRVIGLSATPFNPKLSGFYGRVVNVRTTNELIADKWLVPLRPFGCEHVDISKIKRTSSGELEAGSAGDAAQAIIGRMVPEYREKCDALFGRNAKFLVFSASVVDGRDVVRRFNQEGIPCEQLSYLDDKDRDRRAKVAAYRAGEIRGLVSCEVLQRGADFTDTEMIIDRRAYRKSLSSVIQMYGRGMRPHEGKKYCVLLDQSGNYIRMQDDIEDFYENGIEGLPEVEAKDKKPRDEPTTSPMECPQCGLIMLRWHKECPNCGWKPEKKAAAPKKDIREIGQEMVEIGPKGKRVRLGLSPMDVWGQVMYFACKRYPLDIPKARRFAFAQYKALLPHAPPMSWNMLKMAHEIDLSLAKQIRNNITAYVIRQRKGRAKA